jgi:hypothetical protein
MSFIQSLDEQYLVNCILCDALKDCLSPSSSYHCGTTPWVNNLLCCIVWPRWTPQESLGGTHTYRYLLHCAHSACCSCADGRRRCSHSICPRVQHCTWRRNDERRWRYDFVACFPVSPFVLSSVYRSEAHLYVGPFC